MPNGSSNDRPPRDLFRRGRHPRFPVGTTGAPTALAPDLYPRVIGDGPGSRGGRGDGSPQPSSEDRVRSIDENVDILTRLNLIERGFTMRSVSVGTTPVEIVDGKFLRGYVFLNPSASAGLTSTGTMFASAARTVVGSPYTSGEVGVANFRNAAFFADVTVFGAGSLIAVDLQTQDPLSGNWATAQADIFPAAAITAVGTYYANVGNVGVDVNMRLRASLTVAGSTFSVGYMLKDGLPGSASGIARTIYLGDINVTVGQGYSLLEGQSLTKWFRQNTRLYAVSGVSAGVTINVLESQ